MLQNQLCPQEQVARYAHLSCVPGGGGGLGCQGSSGAVLFNVTQREEIRTGEWALGKTSSHTAEQSMVKQKPRWQLEPNGSLIPHGHLRVQGSVSSHGGNHFDQKKRHPLEVNQRSSEREAFKQRLFSHPTFCSARHPRGWCKGQGGKL